MSYQTILTNLGLAKIAQAIADADGVTPPTVQVSSMVFGDGNGNPTTPSAAQTTLVRQVYSAELNRLELNLETNRYLAEAIVPSDQGGWTVREVGLIDTDGDLFAVASFPDVYKPTPGEGAIRDLVVRLVFEVTNAAEVELIIDSSVVVASRAWVEGNFNLVALLPGGTTHQVLRKRSNTGGDVEWFDPLSGLNVVVDTITEEQTLAASQTVVTLAVVTTNNLAIYIDGLRLHPADYTLNTATQITLTTPATSGQKILMIQNEPLGGVTFLQSMLNLSDLDDAQEARVNLGFPDASNPNFLGELWKALQAYQYPVGEMLITRRSGNPSTWLGFGTWERYGPGRTLVSLDPLDASFQALDQVGGAKTHVLTVGELPSHGHQVNPPQTTSTSAGGLNGQVSLTSGIAGLRYDPFQDGGDMLLTSGNQVGTHQHVVDIAEFPSGNTGSGQAHNNLQPYIVVHIWRRTA